MTVADVDRKIRDVLPGIATVIHEVRQQLRAEFEAEILRLSALLAEVAKRQAIDEARKSRRCRAPEVYRKPPWVIAKNSVQSRWT